MATVDPTHNSPACAIDIMLNYAIMCKYKDWASLSEHDTSVFNVKFCLYGPSLNGLSYQSDACNITHKFQS